MESLRPNYYKLPNGIECKDVTAEFSYNIGTAIAYLWRAGKKPQPQMSIEDKQIEDLNKAITHIQFEIERLEAINREKTERNIEEQRRMY